jgi:hypothetical protein
VSSLHPNSFISQAFSHPILRKISSNSESIPTDCRRSGSMTGVSVNSRSFNCLYIFFSRSSSNLMWLSLRRV